ncbi:GGDEF domain-containing protein [Ferrimonas lipolytica]|uniref:diguanylate cyclase n=1 Tax=Ferrimonas lipolytica TaxID=2724191 RepID=A0A6H1UEV6_9GAMM|nr:GGDEF domain-containing protein [Ferrimonas lipolytica]QIZ77637.1 GGDEF domain-containing protein [Ferrimonas lipolytica]
MSSFQWDKHFITGLATVDSQHKQLVNIINGYALELNQRNVQPQALAQLFEQLIDYSQYHFAEEEREMRTAGVDPRHQQLHVDAHQAFLADVLQQQSVIASNDLDGQHQLLDYLVNWLAFHILGIDQNMARQIQAINAGVTAEQAYIEEERNADPAVQPLVSTLERLYKQVSLRNQQLLTLNRSLEKRIAERTEALSQANKQLEVIASTDSLTGLPNRRYAINRLMELWQVSRQSKRSLVCMVIDADGFKQVNDNYGHIFGDTVLAELGKVLQYAIRTDDIICRVGGDEFFAIFPDTDLNGGLQLAQQILTEVRAVSVPTPDQPWQARVSIGVACSTTSMRSYQELIKLADKGVYLAKAAGKNCIRCINS